VLVINVDEERINKTIEVHPSDVLNVTKHHALPWLSTIHCCNNSVGINKATVLPRHYSAKPINITNNQESKVQLPFLQVHHEATT